ncbi:MAG: hypothetical protein KGZ25_03890 [Planctomycetes bacterium]|nr:hypothetical protein [Planctomycetota bacterium]
MPKNEDTEAMFVGDRTQLMLDDRLIAQGRGIRRRFHRPQRVGGALIRPDARWEQDKSIGLYGSVMREEGLFRAWYFLSSENTRSVCYAESEDGVRWSKPRLGLHELDGSRENNVVISGPDGGGSVWKDPRSAKGERYQTQQKAYPGYPDNPQPSQFRRYVSPDGLHWQRAPIELEGPWDTQSVVFWDERIERYVMYTREWFRFDDKHRNYRAVRRLESDDLVHWDNQSVVMEADETDLNLAETPTGQPPVDYYGAAVFRYPDAGDLYIMLPQAFWHWGRPNEKIINEEGREELAPGTIDARLAWSHDGIHFRRPEARGAFLPTGPDGRFDSRLVWIMPDPIAVGEQLWFYYAGRNWDHHGRLDPVADRRLSGIGRAVLRKDGFASVDAGHATGDFTTPPLEFSGAQLVINAEIGGGGFVRVEIQDESGQPLEDYGADDTLPTTGNSTQLTVCWREGPDISQLAGQKVRVRFLLRDCRLYSFQFET